MSGNSDDTSNSQRRKGIPVISPFNRRTSSSHDLLSAINTLDPKPEKTSSPVSRPTPSSSSTFKSSPFYFPLNVERLPRSLSGFVVSDRSFENLLQKPSSSSCSSSESPKDSKSETPSSTTFSERKANKASHSLEEQTYRATPIKCPAVTLSCFQYRQYIIPPTESRHTFSNLKLTFVEKSRALMLSADIDGQIVPFSIPYSKILRCQFIRKPRESSADWFIDLVLSSDYFNPKIFKLDPQSPSGIEVDAFAYFNTLRLNLAMLCGMCADVIENCLISLISDRKACKITEVRDKYGEFELSNYEISPPKKTSPKDSKLTSDYSSRVRVVPSFDSLSASDSVRLKGSVPRKLTETKNNFFSSPDVFEGRRTSKRLKGSSSGTSSPSPSLKNSFTYVDPDFESDCVKLFSYPEGEIDSILVTSNELKRLDPGIWLNDTLIDFELKYLYEQMELKLKEKVHIYSSFFYRRLSSPKVKKKDGRILTGFDMVKSWTRKIDIFEKNYLVVPINENLHWYLAIICFPSRMLSDEFKEVENDKEEIEKDEDEVEVESEGDEKSMNSVIVDLDPVDSSEECSSSSSLEPESTRILIFDSLGLASRAKGIGVINRLRTYLQAEAQDKLSRSARKSSCAGNICRVPRQENYTDCGCFLLQFVEEFFKATPQPQFLKNLADKKFDLSDWFPPEIAQNRRQIMKERIESFAADYAERLKLFPESVKESIKEDHSSDIEEIEMV